ncbi:FecR family protein [Flavobacterium gelatinilyticum]|uniref:FecR family protein n=1 Tax=Flavobacterium gelatinilyticum TaxID=3003260 RepID=UPI0024813CF2|nr:FecR domain-containing protein [Flavobacterium gelatinilyticum]
MKSKRLKEEWNAIPNRGILPEGSEARMWNNIKKATTDKYKFVYNWIAAACAVFVMFFAGYQFISRNNPTKIEMASTKTFPKDIRLLFLPDGTRVWLNENSEIYYPEKFSGKDRTVTLKGEAFFEVKRDEKRPFIISSGDIKTTVLGTSFSVTAYENKQPEVSVRTGKVKVEGLQNTVFLERGFKAVYSPETYEMQKQKTAVLEPHWKKVLLYVDGLTLGEVIEKLKPEYHFSVNYLDEDLKDLKIQGTLDTRQGFNEMLQTIAFALEIKINPEGNNTFLISR